jgi:hypothetical protein
MGLSSDMILAAEHPRPTEACQSEAEKKAYQDKNTSRKK